MDHDPVAEHYRRQAADIAAEFAPEPGTRWFWIERASGGAWDRLCEPMHAVAAWSLDLAAPRFARPERRITVHRS